MSVIGRREVILGGAALSATLGATLAAGCNKQSGGAAITGDDVAIGNPNAAVTLIEYASVMCPHCKEFHDEVWAQLKRNYIDNGKIRFVLREYPTPAGAAAIVVAGFQVARCGNATPQQYFTRVDVFFDQQGAIMNSGSMDGIKAKLEEIGQSSGLTQAQVDACITDPEGAARMTRFETQGEQLGVTGTPTFFLNGTKIEDPSAVTYAGLSRILDAALAGH